MNRTVTINASPHIHQKTVHDHPARFKVLASGRRWGKTRLGVNECLTVAAQGGRAWWVSPNYRTSEVGWRPLLRFATQIPEIDYSKSMRQITFPNGGSVTVRSADNPNSLRGDGLDFLVADECAFMQEAAWSEALRPSLSDRKGGALFISTPKGYNWFYQLYVLGQDPLERAYKSWTFPTRTSPFIDPEEIADAKRTLPERIFQQEYEAVFLEDAGGVFRKVTQAATATQLEEPLQDHQYIAGVDVATLEDFTVVSVLDAGTNEQVYLDRFNRIDYRALENRLEAVYNLFKLESMVIESNSIGQPVIEAMVERGLHIIPFVTTNATKQMIIQDLQSAFEHQQIKIIPDQQQVSELQAFEGSRSTSGSWKYSAPAGMHDDMVMSLAIAWNAIKKSDSIFLFGV